MNNQGRDLYFFQGLIMVSDRLRGNRFAMLCLCGLLSCLSGCATSTLSASDAQKYASLSPAGFLAQRFNDEQTKKISGHILYTAYYNGVNYRQLFRPTSELILYCQSQGGVPLQTQAYKGDPLLHVFRNPMLEGIEVIAIGRSHNSSQSVIDRATALVVQDALDTNRRYDQAGAQKGFREANDKKMFGVMTCFAEADQREKKWSVSVTPVGFIPKKPGEDLSNHKLVLDIYPLEVSQK